MVVLWGGAVSYERGTPSLDLTDTHRPHGGSILLGLVLLQGPVAACPRLQETAVSKLRTAVERIWHI